MQKKQRGFTLIELLIVIAIIGILAAVAFPVYQTHILKSEIAVGYSELSSVKSSYSVAVSEGETVTDITTIGMNASSSVCTISLITNNGGIQCEFINSSIGTSATLALQYSAGIYTCVAQNFNNTDLLPQGCTQ